MKIKKIINSKHVLLRLSLLKFFQASSNCKSTDFELIELSIKRVLQIIYEYHSANKQILFIDLPLSYSENFKNLSKKTKHYNLSQKMLAKSFLSNGLNSYKHIDAKSQKFQPLQKVRRPDLIVFCNNQPGLNVLKETAALKIPVLSFNVKFLTLQSYSSPKTHAQILFFFMLNSVLKRFLNE